MCFIQDNKDRSNEIGKLLKLSFRLHFLCPFEMWVEIHSNTKRTNNVAELFHVHFNAHFYTSHPTKFAHMNDLYIRYFDFGFAAHFINRHGKRNLPNFIILVIFGRTSGLPSAVNDVRMKFNVRLRSVC